MPTFQIIVASADIHTLSPPPPCTTANQYIPACPKHTRNNRLTTDTHGVLTQDAYKLHCCWQPSKEQATHYTHAPTPCYTVVDRDEANSTLSSATLNKPWCSRRTTQKVLMYIETLTSRPCSRKSLPHHIAQPQKKHESAWHRNLLCHSNSSAFKPVH